MNSVYLTHSIFHIIYSLSIINSKPRKGISYLILAGRDNTRSMEIVQDLLMKGDSALMEGVRVIEISGLIDRGATMSAETIAVIDSVKKLEAEELVTFNEDNFLAVHLGQYFSARNTRVALAQDGTKTYATFKRSTPRYSLMRSYDYYRYCRKNGFGYCFNFVEMKYGKSAYISTLYITNQEAFENKYKKECREVKLDAAVVKMYAATLDTAEIDENAQTIFFVSSLLKWDQALVDLEFKILKMLQLQNPHCQFIFKTHPRAGKEVLDFFKANLELTVISDFVPAEVYTAKLKNAVMLSAYSSAAIFGGMEGNVYKRYWLYPIYGTLLTPLQRFNLTKPDASIITVRTIDQLKTLDLFR